MFLQNCDIDYFCLPITKLTKPYKCDLDIFAGHMVYTLTTHIETKQI